MKKILLFLTILHISYADVTGKVFRDIPVNGINLNQYGVLDSNELGVEGVLVKIYGADGREINSTITDSDGNYTLNINASGNYRIEFSSWASYLKESFDGDNLNSSIRFVKNGDMINFGLHDPDDYSDTPTPDYVISRQQNGSGEDNNNSAIETVHYSDTGLNQDFEDYNGDQGTGPLPSQDAMVKEVGSTWGKAFQKDKKRLFASAVLQRHVGFAPNKGAGEIYILDYSNGSPATLLGSFSLQGVAPINGGDDIDLGSVCRSAECKDDPGNTGEEGDYVLDKDPGTPNIDLDSFSEVGKISYGDIDFDQEHNLLWLVNLNQKAIISIDASGDFASLPNDVKQYKIDDLPNAPTCQGGELRPWALNIHQGRGYLGAVCDALTSQNIDDSIAYIISFDTANPESGFKEELSFGLNYNKDGDDWHPWSDIDRKEGEGDNFKSYIQPILTDIEFDEKNTMYLGFVDRYGLQAGFYNYEPISRTTETNEKTKAFGELMRACYNNGVFELEGTGSCTQTNYSSGEFLNDRGGDTSDDYANGSLALLKGSNELLTTLIDPHPEGDTGSKYWATMGTNTLSTIDGSIQNWYSNLASVEKSYGYNGKASGIGDIELLTPPAPIEVGNRVWLDSDRDGIQDAGEDEIEGVKLILNTGDNCTNKVAEQTTDSNGNYIFEDLAPNTQYTICIDSSQFNDGKGLEDTPLESMLLTKSNDLNASDYIDSDAQLSDSGLAYLTFTTGNIGQNNHSYDIGLVEIYCLGDRIWLDKNRDGIQDSNESNFTESITIELLDENGSTAQDANGNDIDSIRTIDGTYKFCNLLPDKYKVKITPPNDYIISPKDSGSDDTNDSDIDATTKESDLVDLQDDNLTIDIGLYKKSTYCLGDYIWYDDNKNGIQDENESGVSDVNITLNETNAKTTTDKNGKYQFCGLENGEYSIKVNIPNGYVATLKDRDSDDTVDSDIDSNGVSPKVTIQDSNNTTLDAGLTKIKQTYCLGDFIWYDNNHNGIQDSKESGVSNVKITLDQNISKTATTNSNGYYEICGLENGDYSITVDKTTLPNGYEITTKNSGDDRADSDINPSDGKSDAITIQDANNTTLDGGVYKPVTPTYCLGDFIWYDNNHNGVQDSKESGVSNVKITLDQNTSKTDTTDSNGYYEICGLENGDYSITVDKTTLPNGYEITTKNSGDDRADSDINPSDGKSDTITIQDANNTTLDGGVYKPVTPTYCLGDFIWYDNNHNGIQDSKESGVSNVKITLDQNISKTATTNSNGYYEICGLENGNYSITVDKSTLPNGYEITTKNSGDDRADSDINPSDGKSDTITIQDANNTTLDGGVYKPVTPTYCLGDFIWYDNNHNGIQDSKESGVSNVKITLDQNISKTATTNSNGYYEICGLENGNYSITVDKSTLPNGYEITTKNSGDDRADSDINPSDGKSDTITIQDANNTTLDGGVYKPTYCLGDYIWFDNNKNGIQDSNENGVASVDIKVYNNNNEKVGEDKTNLDGSYLVCGLENGEYILEVDKSTLPSGYIFTQIDQGGDDTKDSDINPTDGKSNIIIQDSNNTTIDGGVYKPTYCVGDFVWFDNNKNGIQDSDENGVKDVNIELYNSNGDKIDTVTTNSNGEYQFCGVENGEYTIKVDKTTLPNGYVFTRLNQGDNNLIDSDIDESNSIEIIVRDNNDTTNDIGIYKPTYCLGDFVWFDDNHNGIQDSSESGVEGIEIILNETNTTTTTNSSGYYEFCNLENGTYSITVDKTTLPNGYEITAPNQGENESIDSDIDPTSGVSDSVAIENNSNSSLDVGIFQPTYCIGNFIWFDSNENGIQDSNESGVENVEITLNQTGAKTTTNSSGYYEFCNLTNGDYSITIDSETLPQGYIFTTINSGENDSIDSDIDPTSGESESIRVENGSNTTLDGGVYKPSYCLGDYIWFDNNRNGVQDRDENGVEGVEIILNQTGAMTTTDSNGQYKFCNLENGDYSITIDKTTLPNGYEITSQNRGNSDMADSDISPLDATSDIVTIEDGNNMTLDGGIYKPTYCLGDFVWFDNNHNGIQDNQESGVSGVVIKLYSNNTELGTTTTDSSGQYKFCNLENGEYFIEIDKNTLPSEYQLTLKNQGDNESIDSDIDPTSGRSDNVIVHDSNNMTLDAGVYKEILEEPTPQQEETNSSIVLTVVDDRVEANTQSSTTIIPVLQNDAVESGVTIRLINISDGEILHNSSTAVGGANIRTTDTLIVPDEGVWSVEDGNIVFTAEDGFTGTPTPIYYMVEDQNGNQSNIAEVAINTNCVCEDYNDSVGDSVPSFNVFGILFLIFITSIFSLFSFRREILSYR